jgi:GH43 family beta-xylosidase
LKEKYPGISKENFNEKKYIGIPFENVTGIIKLSDTDYKDFPEWVHSIYIVYFKKNEKNNFSGALKNNSMTFSKDGKVSSFVLLICDYNNINIDMTSTINHEIRHAYTRYIDSKTKKQTNNKE